MANQDEVVSELVAKFRVDKTTLEEAAHDVSGFQERVENLNKEAARVHLEKLKASQDTSKDAYLKNLSEVELLVRAHYEKLKQIHKDSADQILKIQTDLTNDLKLIEANRAAVLTPNTPQNNEASGTPNLLQQLMGRAGSLAPLLSTLGIPMLIGGTAMLTATNLAKEFMKYQGQVLAMDRIGVDLSASAGQFGTGFGYSASKGLESLGHELAMDPKTLAQTTSMLTPMFGLSGYSGGTQAVGMTKDIVGLSKRYGTSESDVAGIMGMYRKLDDVPVEQLAEKFNSLANAAYSASRPVAAFAKDVMQLTQLNAEYGGNLQSNIGLISLFSRELQNGVLTVQDLSRMQFGFANKDPGTQAWVANQLLSRGLIHGSAAQKLSGLSPYSMAFQARAMYEDTSQGGQADREQMMRGIAALSEQEAERFSSSGRSPRDREVMAHALNQQFASQFGGVQAGTIKGTDALIEAMEGHKEASKGMLQAAHATENAQSAIEEGIKSITENVTIQKRISESIEETGQNIYRSMDRMARPEYYAPGNPGYMAETAEKAIKLRGLAGSYFHDEDAMSGVGNSRSAKAQFGSFSRMIDMLARDPTQFFEAGQQGGIPPDELAKFKDANWINSEYRRLSKMAVGIALPPPVTISVENKTPSGLEIKGRSRPAASTPLDE